MSDGPGHRTSGAEYLARERERPQLLRERLRLVYVNVWGTVIPTYVLAVLMYAALATDETRWAVGGWCLAVSASKTWSWLDARHRLARPIDEQRVGRLVMMNAIDGTVWGSIAWAMLGRTSLAGSVLVVAVVCGSTGSSVSQLSPVQPALWSFIGTSMLVVGTKFWTMHDPAYRTLAAGCAIYAANLVVQGRTSSAAADAAIALRFQNTALVDQLHAANVAKSKFLAAASHDLRQPVHALSLFLETLATTALSDKQRLLLANARSAANATAEMLDTLLDFSRIDANVIVPRVRAFFLQPLLQQLEQELAPQADQKGLVYRCREARFAVQSDPALVERILRNLIVNAIRYTDGGGVFIGCRRRGVGVVVEVWDTGVGIAPEDQEAIFSEFHQLGNPERDRTKGLGLGLAIAASLAKDLGQRVTVASRVGRGSVFRLTLPLATEPVVEDVAPPSMAPLRLHVLVIDDDELVCEGMRHLLGEWGCTCDVVATVGEALDAARARRPAVVISDYRLREQRTGAEAVTAVRAAIGSVPALLITGDTAPERLRQAHASGLPLLHKPVQAALLRRALMESAQKPAGARDEDAL